MEKKNLKGQIIFIIAFLIIFSIDIYLAIKKDLLFVHLGISTSFLLIYLFAGIEDIKTKFVSDVYLYIQSAILIIYIIANGYKTIDITPSYLFGDAICFAFLIITIKMRGSADTIGFILWTVYFCFKGTDPAYILLSYLICYLLQGIIQIIFCFINKTSWKDKPYLPFFPAITLGMGTILIFL